MSNTRAISVPAVVASLLAIGGLGYAHLRLEGIAWVFRVFAGSIWRVLAANFAGSFFHAGMLLLPLAVVTIFMAEVVSRRP